MGLSLPVEVYHMVVQGKCFRAPHKVIPYGEAEASIFLGGHGKKRKERKEASACRNFQALQYAEKKFNTWNLTLHCTEE